MVGVPQWRLQHESEVLTLTRATGALSITQALTILFSGRLLRCTHLLSFNKLFA